MKLKMKAIALIAVLAVIGTAQADVVSHYANIVTDNLGSMLQDEGTLVQAGNYGGVAVTVGGIDFAAATAAVGWTTTTAFGGTDANINLLVNTQYAKTWAVKTATTITGLTVGQEYRVQILGGEPWAWSDCIVQVAGTAAPAGNFLAIVDGTAGMDLVVFEFVAAGDTLDIQYGTVGTDNGAIAAYAVHAIPEPATVGMLGLGALVTLLVRRFKRA